MKDLTITAFSKEVVESVCSKREVPSKLNLASMFHDVCAGTYHIQPPRIVKVPKDNGGIRELTVCTDKDRFLLAMVNEAWFKLFGDRVSEACTSYRTGCSTASTVKKMHKHLGYGYKLDLSKYFDSVPRVVLNEALESICTYTPLDAVIYDFYNDDCVVENKSIVTKYKSLGQGCATSAFLADYILCNIDDEMSHVCGYYCRYSDDMLIISPDADEILGMLEHRLSLLGLQLNPSKVQQIDENTPFKFLGFEIDGDKINIAPSTLQQKKKDVKHVCKMHKGNLSKALKEVQKLFFSTNYPTHGWLYSKCQAVNQLDRIIELDTYCKDCLRACATGTWNYTHNIHAVDLEKAGWVSLTHMAKMAWQDSTLFEAEQLIRL